MAREGTADPVNDALQRVSQDEPRREAATNEEAIDWVIVALVVLVLALIGLGRSASRGVGLAGRSRAAREPGRFGLSLRR